MVVVVGCHSEAAGATTQTVPSARMSERRNGLGRGSPPRSSNATEDGQGREWVRDELHGDDPEEPTLQLELFELFDEEPGGSRPDRHGGVRPQERVQRHTVEQIVDAVPGLPTHEAPVPVMVEQLVDVLQFFDALLLVAVQVIDVPKIILEDIPTQTPLCDPQLVEQLVEVPTILYFLKQKVDIPVPFGGARLAGVQGFLPGQSSTVPSVEQNVDIPARGGGLQCFHQRTGFSSFFPSGSLCCCVKHCVCAI